MKNAIKKFLFDTGLSIYRKDMLKKVTSNLGKCVVANDRIICFVDNKKLEEYKGFSNGDIIYNIFLWDTNMVKDGERTRELSDINKPIYYIIKDMVFDVPLTIGSSDDCFIVFKNCYFNGISIKCANNIVFEDNTYFSKHFYYLENEKNLENEKELFECYDARSISFVNDYLIDYHRRNSKIVINADKINIVNSYVRGNTVSLSTDKLEVDDSEIKGCEMYIVASNIKNHNGSINANTGIIVDNENCNYNQIHNIYSPCTIYNGIELGKVNDDIDEEKFRLQEQRMILIDILKKVKQSCENTISYKTQEIRKQPVKRVLKR